MISTPADAASQHPAELDDAESRATRPRPEPNVGRNERIASGLIGGALLLGAFLNRHFSFAVLAGAYLWAAVCVFLIGTVGASVPLLAATIVCAGIGIIGGQNASHALSSEFYPTRMRSTGVGWALGIGRIGSIVGPMVGGQLLAQGTAVNQVFWVATIPALVATAAAASIAFVGKR